MRRHFCLYAIASGHPLLSSPPTLSDIHQIFTGGRAVFHALLPFLKNIAQCSGPTVFHVVLPRGPIHFVFLVDEVGLRLGLAEALFSSRITCSSLMR